MFVTFDSLSSKDQNALLDFTRALVLYRKIEPDMEYLDNMPQEMWNKS